MNSFFGRNEECLLPFGIVPNDNPSRNLDPLTEEQKSSLLGRESEVGELADLVGGDTFRAGLLYGEPGVGKTSLLQAGVIPELEKRGITPLLCTDPTNAVESLAKAMQLATGLEPQSKEPAVSYLVRLVSEAVEGQLYLFIIDEAELVLRNSNMVNEVGDLFARAAARSGGRARFLFAAATGRIHMFGALEKRTGSLFPPRNRYCLGRLNTDSAGEVAAQMNGVDAKIGAAMAEKLADQDGVLPIDLALATQALSENGKPTLDDLEKGEGLKERIEKWFEARVSGVESSRVAMRLLAALDHRDGQVPRSIAEIAKKAGLSVASVEAAVPVLEKNGLISKSAGTGGSRWILRHEVIGTKIQQSAASAQMAAKKAFGILGAKKEKGGLLSFREWREVVREKIEGSDSKEKTLLARSSRFWKGIIIGALALPLVLIAIAYFSLSGNFYLSIDRSTGVQRVVVNKGRLGLRSLFWLPASPGWGTKIAESSYGVRALSEGSAQSIENGEVGGEGDYSRTVDSVLHKETVAIRAYAKNGDADALAFLVSISSDDAARIGLLKQISFITRGTDAELALMNQLLEGGSSAVKRAVVRAATLSFDRGVPNYNSFLAKLLAGTDVPLRKRVTSSVLGLSRERAQELSQLALTFSPSANAKKNLRRLGADSNAGIEASRDRLSGAIAGLSLEDTKSGVRVRLENIVLSAIAKDSSVATERLLGLAKDETADVVGRKFALDTLRKFADESEFPRIEKELEPVWNSGDDSILNSSMPLLARISPEKGAERLSKLQENSSPQAQATAALTLGELLAAGDDTAEQALTELLESKRAIVRAAAAEAIGASGRSSQRQLVKLINDDNNLVAAGAVRGLVRSVEEGGSANTAVNGIVTLWKKDGQPKRVAARAFADIARKRPKPVVSYLAEAAVDSGSNFLRTTGISGLCISLAEGNRRARQGLLAAAKDAGFESRKSVADCAIENASKDSVFAENAASQLIEDPRAEIRLLVGEILSLLSPKQAGNFKNRQLVVSLARDTNSSVRIQALKLLAALGEQAPGETDGILSGSLLNGSVAEKLAALGSARELGRGKVIQTAFQDNSAIVREAALETAIATNTNVLEAVSASMSDSDPMVRKAVLQKLGEEETGLEEGEIISTLSVAMQDPDVTIRDYALKMVAKRAPIEEVKERLRDGLSNRSEDDRARAARAAEGLAERDPEQALAFLEPYLEEPSHDVRVALLPAFAKALSRARTANELSAELGETEANASRRIFMAAALGIQAETNGREGDASVVLKQLGEDGSPFVAELAKTTVGLLENRSDILGFFSQLMP